VVFAMQFWLAFMDFIKYNKSSFQFKVRLFMNKHSPVLTQCEQTDPLQAIKPMSIDSRRGFAEQVGDRCRSMLGKVRRLVSFGPSRKFFYHTEQSSGDLAKMSRAAERRQLGYKLR
jgi:hypothetical protein